MTKCEVHSQDTCLVSVVIRSLCGPVSTGEVLLRSFTDQDTERRVRQEDASEWGVGDDLAGYGGGA